MLDPQSAKMAAAANRVSGKALSLDCNEYDAALPQCRSLAAGKLRILPLSKPKVHETHPQGSATG